MLAVALDGGFLFLTPFYFSRNNFISSLTHFSAAPFFFPIYECKLNVSLMILHCTGLIRSVANRRWVFARRAALTCAGVCWSVMFAITIYASLFTLLASATPSAQSVSVCVCCYIFINIYFPQHFVATPQHHPGKVKRADSTSVFHLAVCTWLRSTGPRTSPGWGALGEAK